MTALDAPETASIPAGSFLMGGREGDKFVGNSERPLTEVAIEKSFSLGVFPVTEAEFSAFDQSYSSSELPVVNVSWIQASAYCDWLSEELSQVVRLPTESEWEYACRAGANFIFQQGDMLEPSQACYYYDESGNRIGPGRRTAKGQYPSNDFGLCDMLGNVCEWTSSDWTDTLDPDASPDPKLKVIRGGAWDYLPRLLRASWRDAFPPSQKRDNIGFRILIES